MLVATIKKTSHRPEAEVLRSITPNKACKKLDGGITLFKDESAYWRSIGRRDFGIAARLLDDQPQPLLGNIAVGIEQIA
jgi:hypothetical protein